MHIVQKGELAPGCCILTGDIDGPFLDTGFAYNAETMGVIARAYLHLPLVKQMGRAAGMVASEEMEAAQAEISRLTEEIGSLERELAEQQAELGAIRTLEKRAYVRKRRPGRPPTKQPTKVTISRKELLSG